MFRALEQKDWPFIKKHIGCRQCEDTRGLVYETKDGDIQGACVLDTWSKNSVQAHIVVVNPMCLRHGFLEEISMFVFTTAGMGVMMGIVPANNAKALKFDRHIGFTELFRIKDGYDVGVDTVVMQMRRENCPWLDENRSAA